MEEWAEFNRVDFFFFYEQNLARLLVSEQDWDVALKEEVWLMFARIVWMRSKMCLFLT